ncbi:MAG: hypothetical protein GWN58_49925 [Anaerolineae bacterium]|nr:hypothetical protein [Anaerolineae bacterium]
MSGSEAGEFISVGLGLAVLAVVAALAIAAPWVGVLVLAGGLAWLVRGWRRDLRQGCRR